MILSLLWISLAPACTQSKPVVLVDYSHGEIFMPLDVRPYGYGKFNKLFEKSGFKLKILDKKVSEDNLKKAQVYLIAGSMKEFSDDEIRAIEDFVSQGGKLIVLIHIYPVQKKLLDEFGVDVLGVVAEEENLGNPLDFTATRIENSPITAGVKELNFYGAWAISLNSSGKALVLTSDKAWVDYNRNGIRDDGEPTGTFSLVQLVRHGRGYVLVIADDAPLINRFVEQANNMKLAENIIRWCSS